MSLSELKEYFYLGYYNKVIEMSTTFDKGDEEVEFLVLRSRLFLNQVDFVLNLTKTQNTGMYKGLYLLSQSLKQNNKDDILQLLKSLDQTLIQKSKHYVICVSIIYNMIEEYLIGLEILQNFEDIEVSSLRVQMYLNIHRIDLAETELIQIKDSILYSINCALISFFKGEDEVKNSLFSLLDLSERFETSPILMNLISVCHFYIGEWENGRNCILTASEQFPNDESVGINYAVSLSHSSFIEQLNTQLSLIKNYRNNYNEKIQEMLKTFDETATRLLTEE